MYRSRCRSHGVPPPQTNRPQAHREFIELPIEVGFRQPGEALRLCRRLVLEKPTQALQAVWQAVGKPLDVDPLLDFGIRIVIARPERAEPIGLGQHFATADASAVWCPHPVLQGTAGLPLQAGETICQIVGRVADDHRDKGRPCRTPPVENDGAAKHLEQQLLAKIGHVFATEPQRPRDPPRPVSRRLHRHLDELLGHPADLVFGAFANSSPSHQHRQCSSDR
jgi:hypothetical protein